MRSTVHPETNMRVDTFLKPLGNLTKGRVLNTRPWGAAGRLARPDPDGDDPILIARVAFDIVHGDTLESFPSTARTTTIWSSTRAPNPPLRAATTRARAPSSLRAASALSSPAGGAEWRGAQADDERRHVAERRPEKDEDVSPDATTSTSAFAPRSAPAPFPFAPPDASNLWVEPAGAEWGANVHLIDLRGVASVRDAVQCNCASYGARTPGTPLDFDGSALARRHRVLRRRRALPPRARRGGGPRAPFPWRFATT